MVRLLVIDCFDSFVYNLVQILRESRICTYDICTADNIPLESLSNYDALLLSPGPGVPEELPLLMQAIALCANSHHILGICLGHQAIGVYFGGKLRQIERPLHGHTDTLHHTGTSILEGIEPCSKIGRYHSWVVDEVTLPCCLEILGVSGSSDTEIMAMCHQSLPIYGLQFHPESIMTQDGKRYIINFLNEVTQSNAPSPLF